MHWTLIFSHLFGEFASKRFSPAIQRTINRLYTKLTRLDMSEFEDPDNYSSLNTLFSRRLKYERKIADDAGVVISPVDALITECGTVEDGLLLQIKGMSYSVDKLLTKQYSKLVKKVYSGNFINFYLSPKDYHRYHAPCRLKVASILYEPGKLYPVNSFSCRRMPELFIQNERVIMECYDIKDRLVFIVLVGALDVGKIVISFDSRVHKNANPNKSFYYEYEDLWLEKAEQIGMFMLGSTVVMISQPGAFDNIKAERGKKVCFGQEIARLA